MLRLAFHYATGNEGSGNTPFTMLTGLAARQATRFRLSPLSRYAHFPLVFPLKGDPPLGAGRNCVPVWMVCRTTGSKGKPVQKQWS